MTFAFSVVKSLRQALTRFLTSVEICWKTLKLVWSVEKRLFALSLAANIIPAITPFITAYIFKLIIDQVALSISGSLISTSYLFLLFIILIAGYYIQRLTSSVQDYVAKIFYIKLPIHINQMVLNKISTLDLQHFENSDFQDILQKVRESYHWRPQRLVDTLMLLIQNIVKVSIAFYAIFHLNPLLALLIIFVAIPDLVNQVLFSKFSWNVWDHKTPDRRKFGYAQHMLQNISTIKELKIFEMREKFLKLILDIQINFFNANKKIASNQLLANSGFGFLDTVVSSGILGYVVWQAVQKKITLGDISFYQSVVSNFNGGVYGLFRNLSVIYDHSQYISSVFEVLETKSTLAFVENPIKISSLSTPKIEFKDVYFKYPGSKRYIFKNFSLVINPGEKIALVGENGAGKTTLIKLLARLYDVNQGEILINDINIKELNLTSWYRSLGVLFQDFIHYEYTVLDNISFGKSWENYQINDVTQAARSAGANQMIQNFDNKYDQMLGKTFEGGIELSGGQWQKIALARAFYRNAPVLILDEPTAAIDAKAEAEIFNRVERLAKDKTVIIISHRFSTVRNADKIYVVKAGQIQEAGNHKQLMDMNGQYAELFKLQAKGYQ